MEATEESKSERKKEAKAQRQRADAPPLPPKDKDGVVGGDTVFFEQIQPNVAYLIENVARKHLEGRAYDVKYHARWTDGIPRRFRSVPRALPLSRMISAISQKKAHRRAAVRL